MKAKISHLAAQILIQAWVLEDRKTDPPDPDDVFDTPENETQSYMRDRETGLTEVPFSLDNGTSLVYNRAERAWYIQDEPIDMVIEHLLEVLRPSWA